MAKKEHPEMARYLSERDWFTFLREQTIALAEIPEMQLQTKTLDSLLEMYGRIIDAVYNEKPFVASYYCLAPELLTAMDLPYYMVMQTPFLASSVPYLVDDIDASEAIGLGNDLCTAIRLSIYYVEANLSPLPTCALNLLYPCDAAPLLHEVIVRNERWRDIPMFGCDPPYYMDDRSLDYFADQLRQMGNFVATHTGRKLDLDRLKETVEESNRMFSLWDEYNQLRRNVPSPHGWGIGGPQAFSQAWVYRAGMKEGTEWFQKLVDIAELNVKSGVGPIPKEKIRLFWFDLLPFGWVMDFLPWLEEEWGAVMVMDMFGNFPYTMIDTSSEEEMWRGLARRNLFDAPMVRQARGVADNFSGDIQRIVKDYKIDVVVWPGHMGHKDGAATVGIMRETCRDLGVPFVHLGLDLFDRRYSTPEQVKDKISEFFRAMGLG
ncbi:MAG: 2-hydroxyacyl-CoA dehydratase family protein [Dehalococcoidia bacterium]